MKPMIFAYEYATKTYYAEGFSEDNIRQAVEKKLNLPPNTLPKGRKPDYNKELKEIWNKANKNMKLFLTKEFTSPRDEIELNKKRQHCIYELGLLLSEDKNFLSGVNDIIVMDPDLDIRLYPNTGHEMCYQGNIPDTDKIYRFPKGMIDAYWYIRNNIIKFDIAEWPYKKTGSTVLEMCDSIIAGFTNPIKVNIDNPNDMIIPAANRQLPMGLLYKSTT